MDRMEGMGSEMFWLWKVRSGGARKMVLGW